MRSFSSRVLSVVSLVLVATAASAQPQGLERVGPTSTVNGFPTWYQDKTGVTLEFCQPTNQAELDGGWCLLLPGDTAVPEAFPQPFADEHFYWAADAAINAPALDASLVLAIEAAFAVGPVIDGDQLVFGRVRFRFDAPVTGTYTVFHPYGTDVVEAVAGERVFVTEDLGIQCGKGAFECALRSRVGPFLLASSTPGGSELAAVPGPVPGKLYIADPERVGPVTGSPVGQNYFRIVGPAGSNIDVSTTDFSLMGRLYQGTMPGRMTVERASYSRAAGSVQGKLDVFASAFATAQPRFPGAPIVGAVTPLLGFYPAACTVATDGTLGAPVSAAAVQMFSSGSRFYGQMEGDVPTAICVQDYTARDSAGRITPLFNQSAVTDQVAISEATFDPANGGMLHVAATSSDANAPPQLTAVGVGAFASGASIDATVGVPASKVVVTSERGGSAELLVTTLAGTLGGGDLPFAGNDAFTLGEDGGAAIMQVLANDTVGGRTITAADNAVVAIVDAPRLGTATVNLDGTITFVPAENAFGTDLLTYIVTVGSSASLPAFVSITITSANDPPVANPDSASGVGNLGMSIALLTNDTDVDGAADLVGINITRAPAGVTYAVVGGTLTFTAPAGTHTFSYVARDMAGALSNEATVTVTLSGGETLQIARAEYIGNKRRWRVEGSSSVPAGGQTVYVMYASGMFADGTPAAGYLIGTAVVDAAGLWALDFTLAGTNDPRNPTSTILFATRPTSIYAITTLGGSSPAMPIAIR